MLRNSSKLFDPMRDSLLIWKGLTDDLTDVQIAIELGVDRKTVAMRFARIYRKLRQLDASES